MMEELALHILDMVQNSLEAGATRVSVRVEEDTRQDLLSIEVTDNGQGMTDEVCRQVLNPFFTTRKTRRVGLGLPFLQEAASACGGGLIIKSQPGKGTMVIARFQHSHIDRMPLGDMAKTLMVLLSMTEPEQCELEYTHQINQRCFTFNTRDLRDELGIKSFSSREARSWFRQYVAEGESWIREGMNDAKA